MNPLSASNAAPSSSSNPSQSTLRPRQRRLISGLDEELQLNPGSSSNTRDSSPLPSPFGSRAASPIPNKHPSRTTSSQTLPRTNLSSSRSNYDGSKQGAQGDPFGSLSGLWGNSWSAIQGLASSVLGGDVEASDSHGRRRRPLEATHSKISNGPLLKWGPSASTIASQQIGAGTKEERESMVRAMKRKDLLNANGHIYADAAGKFKRRNSDERISSSAPPGDAENRDALIYVHKVCPQDTLAGITIKFNCQAAVLRKANRMWPNDTVQSRKTIVIPVDACGVKGKPVPAPAPTPADQEEDLLLGSYEDKNTKPGIESSSLAAPTIANGSRQRGSSDVSTRPRSNTSSSKADADPPWIHDSWVLLPNDTEPTEIARLPRRSLGYFPPARRKSVTFSETTPTTSLDLPRASVSSSSPRHSNAPTSSPSVRPSRPRTQSITATFPLTGPGGVGSLGKNVRKPGPAQDGLNKFFGTHLPNVAPPAYQTNYTPWLPGLLDLSSYPEGASVSTSQVVTTPGGSVVKGFDFENVGGAIEGWMRKTATKVSKAMNDASKNASAAPVPGIGAEGGNLGDLIELQDDPFEIGDDERGVVAASRGRGPTTMTMYGSTGRATGPGEEGMRERDRGKGVKSGKGD